MKSLSTDPGEAKAALDRIVIPQDALDRIGGMASPQTSLIISDEALSPDAGNGTDFVIVMSGPVSCARVAQCSLDIEFSPVA